MLEWESFSWNDEWYYYTFLDQSEVQISNHRCLPEKLFFFQKNKLRIALKTLSPIDDPLSVNPEQ